MNVLIKRLFSPNFRVEIKRISLFVKVKNFRTLNLFVKRKDLKHTNPLSPIGVSG